MFSNSLKELTDGVIAVFHDHGYSQDLRGAEGPYTTLAFTKDYQPGKDKFIGIQQTQEGNATVHVIWGFSTDRGKEFPGAIKLFAQRPRSEQQFLEGLRLAIPKLEDAILQLESSIARGGVKEHVITFDEVRRLQREYPPDST